MTNLDYSILGLKDLLNDIEELSTCLMSLSALSHSSLISSEAFDQLVENQFTLIQKANSYASILKANETNLPN